MGDRVVEQAVRALETGRVEPAQLPRVLVVGMDGEPMMVRLGIPGDDGEIIGVDMLTTDPAACTLLSQISKQLGELNARIADLESRFSPMAPVSSLLNRKQRRHPNANGDG